MSQKKEPRQQTQNTLDKWQQTSRSLTSHVDVAQPSMTVCATNFLGVFRYTGIWLSHPWGSAKQTFRSLTSRMDLAQPFETVTGQTFQIITSPEDLPQPFETVCETNFLESYLTRGFSSTIRDGLRNKLLESFPHTRIWLNHPWRSVQINKLLGTLPHTGIWLKHSWRSAQQTFRSLISHVDLAQPSMTICAKTFRSNTSHVGFPHALFFYNNSVWSYASHCAQCWVTTNHGTCSCCVRDYHICFRLFALSCPSVPTLCLKDPRSGVDTIQPYFLLMAKLYE